MLSVVKKIRIWQITEVICLIALVVVYFVDTARPTVAVFADIKNSVNQTVVIKGRETPIKKTGAKSDFPRDMDDYSMFMLLNPPLRMVSLDDAEIPLYASKWGLSEKSKLAVKIVKINETERKKLKLDQYSIDHPETQIGDYILIEKPAWLLRILVIAVGLIGIKLMRIGVQRAREYVANE